MRTFKKNNIIHRVCYDFSGIKRNRKCVFNLQIKGKGWRQVARGNTTHYDVVIHLLKTNDFTTHKEAREILIKGEKALY